MRTWMITGISSGIGYEFARQLLGAGERVIGTVRRWEPVRALQEIYPDTLIVGEVDVRNYEGTERFVRYAFEKFENIDVIVSNAGIGIKGAVEEVAEGDIEDVISTNLTGAVMFIRACVPYLKRQGYGRVIQISSMCARIAEKGWAYYTAAKYGVNGFCEVLAREIEPWGIRVTIIEPGTVRTPYWEHSKMVTADGSEMLSWNMQNAEIDPKRMVRLIISSCDSPELPLHIVMGERAHKRITETLKHDLEIYETQKQLAKDANAVRYVSTRKKLVLPEHVGERKLLMWGLGADGDSIVRYFDWTAWDQKLYGFIEKNPEKAGKVFVGRRIFSPQEIKEWNPFFVIVATSNWYQAVKAELEQRDLKEETDFCWWKKLCKE